MIIPLAQFDISKYESSGFGPQTPDLLLSKLMYSIQSFSAAKLNSSVEQRTEIKLRAALNALVYEGHKHSAACSENSRKTSISYFLPRLSEIVIADENELDLVLIQNKLVVFAPKMDTPSSIPAFVSKLNDLTYSSKGAKTWLVDLSAVEKMPFELFGYLIGLKMALARDEIELELMWLKINAVPQELMESTQNHFNLYSKGAFLLSKTNSDSQ